MTLRWDDSDTEAHLRDDFGEGDGMDEQGYRFGDYETVKRGRGWEAHQVSNHGVWEFGHTEAEALGKLVIRLHMEREYAETMRAEGKLDAENWLQANEPGYVAVVHEIARIVNSSVGQSYKEGYGDRLYEELRSLSREAQASNE